MKASLRAWPCTLVVLLAPLCASAQQAVPVDTTGLGSGAGATMHMLYERTIFRVDVLDLTLRFGPEAAQRLSDVLSSSDGRRSDDALANTALDARQVLARVVFRRDVRLGQFLDGLESNLRAARSAGIVSAGEFDTIMRDVRAQYESLRERGFRDRDTMWYRVRGDSLHVVVQSADGAILLDERVIGPERRRSVLGGYLAPGSDFRKGLLESIQRAS